MGKKDSDNEKIHEPLSKVYYKPEHLWMGRKAVNKLYEAIQKAKKKINSWLAQQALWQVHISPPKKQISQEQTKSEGHIVL